MCQCSLPLTVKKYALKMYNTLITVIRLILKELVLIILILYIICDAYFINQFAIYKDSAS